MIPRDSAGTFEPKTISKRQKNLPDDLELQIFALYARGSSMADIRNFIVDMRSIVIRIVMESADSIDAGNLSQPQRIPYFTS